MTYQIMSAIRSLSVAVLLLATLAACRRTAGTDGGAGAPTGTGGGTSVTICPDLSQPACKNGEVQPCYQGGPGTEGTGSCHAGKQTCVGNAFGVCEGQGSPAPATCAAPTVLGCGAAPSCGAAAFQIVPPPPSTGHSSTGIAAGPSGDLFVVGSIGTPSLATAAPAALDLGGGLFSGAAFAARFDPSGGHV